MRYCGKLADWSVWNGRFGRPDGRFLFVCEYHRKILSQPLVGIDRPSYADESWKPSIDDHIRLSIMETNRQDRAKQQLPREFVPTIERERRYTPAQIENLMVLRQQTRCNKIK